MKFFIPSLEHDAALAEDVYASLARQIADGFGPLVDRRIFRLDYDVPSRTIRAEVGQDHPITGHLVVAIVALAERPLYLVCTLDRSLLDHRPLMVDRDRVVAIVEFDAG